MAHCRQKIQIQNNLSNYLTAVDIKEFQNCQGSGSSITMVQPETWIYGIVHLFQYYILPTRSFQYFDSCWYFEVTRATQSDSPQQEWVGMKMDLIRTDIYGYEYFSDRIRIQIVLDVSNIAIHPIHISGIRLNLDSDTVWILNVQIWIHTIHLVFEPLMLDGQMDNIRTIFIPRNECCC